MTEYSSPLPASWIEVPIETLLVKLIDGKVIQQGWSPQCEKEASKDSNTWGVLKTTAIQSGMFYPEHNKCLPNKLSPRDHLEVQEGDILLTCAGPRSRCGIPCYVRTTRPKLILSGKMYRFRVCDEVVEPRYLEAFLQTPDVQSKIDSMKTGISDSGLNLTHNRFLQLPVRVPPLYEQRRITERLDELFSDLSAGVSALERVKRKLVRYRATVLHAAVTGRLTKDWRKKHGSAEESGSKLLEHILAERRRQWEQRTVCQYEQKGKIPPKNWRSRYSQPKSPKLENDEAGRERLPGGWCYARVEQLTHTIQYGTSAKTNDDASGIPVLRMGNINTKGAIDFTNMKYLPKDHDEFPELFLVPGDVLFNRTNSAELVGKTAVFDPSDERAMSFASYLIRVRTIQGCSPWWLTWCVISPLGHQWLRRVLNHTAGQANVNGTKLGDYVIPLPPVEEQNAIVDIVNEKLSQIDALEIEVTTNLSRASRLRQSVLKSAFEGKLASQDIDDESASILLERIKNVSPGVTLKRTRKPNKIN